MSGGDCLTPSESYYERITDSKKPEAIRRATIRFFPERGAHSLKPPGPSEPLALQSAKGSNGTRHTAGKATYLHALSIALNLIPS